MTIRRAEIKDIPQLHRMGRRFHEVSGYAEISEYSPASVGFILKGMIEAGTVFTDGEHGLLGFTTFPLFFDPSVIIAQEMFWWVDEAERKTGLGVELLDVAENRAKAMGAKALLMLSIKGLEGDKVNKLYLSRGYQEQENSYMRSL